MFWYKKGHKSSSLRLDIATFSKNIGLRTARIMDLPVDFPAEFTVSMQELKRSVTFERIKNDAHYPIGSANVYTIDSSSHKVKKQAGKSMEKVTECFFSK